MYGYKWIDGENGIFKLDISVSVQKEIRPVFKEELDFCPDFSNVNKKTTKGDKKNGKEKKKNKKNGKDIPQ